MFLFFPKRKVAGARVTGTSRTASVEVNIFHVISTRIEPYGPKTNGRPRRFVVTVSVSVVVPAVNVNVETFWRPYTVDGLWRSRENTSFDLPGDDVTRYPARTPFVSSLSSLLLYYLGDNRQCLTATCERHAVYNSRIKKHDVCVGRAEPAAGQERSASCVP